MSDPETDTLCVTVAGCRLTLVADSEIRHLAAQSLAQHLTAPSESGDVLRFVRANRLPVEAERRAGADPIHPSFAADSAAWYTRRAVFRFTTEGFECLFDGSPSGGPERFYYRFLAFALQRVLWSRGRLFVHAGAVVDPTDRRRVALVGPSGSAKSTICVAFLETGWKLLSDDTVFASLDGEPQLYTLRRPMHLDRKLATTFPRLGALRNAPPYLEGKQKVSCMPAQYYPGQVIEHLPLPTTILFPRIADVPVSRLRELAGLPARDLLDNSALPDHGHDTSARRSSRQLVLDALLASARCFELSCGRDALADPLLLPALVESVC